MSDFQDMITDDLDDVFFNTDEFAQTITYNGESVSAIVQYGPRRRSADQIVSCDAWITVKTADVSSPAYRDTIVIGSNTYKVLIDDQTQPEGDGYIWVIDLKRDERPIPGGRR